MMCYKCKIKTATEQFNEFNVGICKECANKLLTAAIVCDLVNSGVKK